jgi:hypothetical protein
VLRTIVEGEPGIFPDPVARVMRTIGGWFDRRRSGDDDPRPGPGSEGGDGTPGGGGRSVDDRHGVDESGSDGGSRPAGST